MVSYVRNLSIGGAFLAALCYLAVSYLCIVNEASVKRSLEGMGARIRVSPVGGLHALLFGAENDWKITSIELRHVTDSDIDERTGEWFSYYASQATHCESLSCEGIALSGPSLLNLTSLTSLRSLELVDAELTEQDCAAIADLPHIERLILDGCRMKAAGLKHLARAERMTTLSLSYAQVEPGIGMAFLGATRLEQLSINGAVVQVTDLEALRQLPRLHHLEIANCVIDDRDALWNMLRRSEIKRLSLSGLAVSDAELAFLPPEIEALELYESEVSDVGASKLAGLQRLSRLSISSPSLTQRGKMILRRHVLHCHIIDSPQDRHSKAVF
jgi:hypothetical protein